MPGAGVPGGGQPADQVPEPRVEREHLEAVGALLRPVDGGRAVGPGQRVAHIGSEDQFGQAQHAALVNFYGNAVATLVIATWDRNLDVDRARRVLATHTAPEPGTTPIPAPDAPPRPDVTAVGSTEADRLVTAIR